MLSLWPALLAAVPSVSVGPDDAARAPRITAPITRVTVFEDRARVQRRGTVDVTAGASAWRLPDLPGGTDLGAVRATVTGAGRLLRLEAAPAERDRLRIEPAAQLLDRLDAHDDSLRRLDDERQVVATRAQLLAALAPAPAVDEARREGRPAAGLFSEAWVRVASFLSAERGRLAERVVAIEGERRAVAVARADVARELAVLDLGGTTESVVEVLVVIEAAQAGKALVELEYFTPGARWRPAYELRFYADEGRAELAAFGQVTQNTGEDWPDVELHLSTALPSLGIELPKLLTWTLGEAKEWRPTVYPRSAPPAVPLFELPTARPTRSETSAVVERGVLMARLGRVAQGVPATSTYDFDDDGIAGGLVRPSGQGQSGVAYGRSKVAESAPASRPPPPPPPAPPPRAMEMLASPTREVSRSAGVVTAVDAESASGSSYASRALALFDAPPPPRFAPPPDSPAAMSGRLDYVYVATTRATVPSRGETFRVPLTRETHPVTAFYEATPALAPQAYLRATVTSRSPRPILGGPVGIFLGTAYAGDGMLATTGPGGTLALPLGGDEDVRVSRKMILTTETKGVFSKDEVTTYRVVLEVASFKKKTVRVVVREPLPISDHEDVEVKLVATTPKTGAPDEDGIVTWSVEVAPGKVAKLELVYRIGRPEDFQLQQR